MTVEEYRSLDFPWCDNRHPVLYTARFYLTAPGNTHSTEFELPIVIDDDVRLKFIEYWRSGKFGFNRDVEYDLCPATTVIENVDPHVIMQFFFDMGLTFDAAILKERDFMYEVFGDYARKVAFED